MKLKVSISKTIVRHYKIQNVYFINTFDENFGVGNIYLWWILKGFGGGVYFSRFRPISQRKL